MNGYAGQKSCVGKVQEITLTCYLSNKNFVGEIHDNRTRASVVLFAGVLKEWYVQPLLDPDYYTKITKETDEEWKKTHGGKNVSETIKEYLVTYLGEPITKMLR